MGRDAQVEVRIRKSAFHEWTIRPRGASSYWQPAMKRRLLWVVLVNGRRVDSFLKRENAEAKARKLRAPSL